MDSETDFDRYLKASQLALREGRHAEGAAWAEKAAAEREDGEAWALLALHRLRLGDLKSSLTAGQQARILFENSQEPGALSQLLGTMAVAFLQAELVSQGLAYAQEAVAQALVAGDLATIGWADLRLGQALRIMGETSRSEEQFTKAMAAALSSGDQGLQFSVLYNQAWQVVDGLLREAPLSDSQLEIVLQQLEQAQKIAETENNAHSRGICLLNRSRVRLRLNDRTSSSSLAEEALALGTLHGLTQLTVGAQTVLCEWNIREGKAAEALVALLQFRPTLSDDDLISHLDILRLIVRAYRELGLFREALLAFEELHALSLRQAVARSDLQVWMSFHHQEVERAHIRAEQAELDAEIQRLKADRWQTEANHDVLTGLSNRRFVEAHWAEMAAHARTSGQHFLAAMLDLDHFKQINDRYGHEIGDEVLRAVGQVLRNSLRARDLPARLGGEEFLVLITVELREQAQLLCERIRQSIQEYDWSRVAPGLQVTVSIGLASPGTAESPWNGADAALYQAKAQGRNRVVTT